MKIPKSTTPEVPAGTPKEADSKPYDSEAWRDENALFGLREEIEKNIPPVSEIAHLAALLTHGGPAAFQNPEVAARQAVEVWAACSRQRAAWIDGLARRKLMREKEEAKLNALGQPKKFPISLDEFLQLALPDNRTEDRLKLWRDYLRENIRFCKQYPGTGGSVIPYERIPPTTDDEVADCIARHRKRGFDESQYSNSLTFLRNYAAAIKREKLKIRGQTAGKASANKKAKDKAEREAKEAAEREAGKPIAKKK
jgi:hypothetical protein